MLDTTPGLTSRTSESIDITTGLNNYYYSYINQDGSLFVGLKTVNDKTYFFNEEGKSVPGIQKAENGKNYYFNQMTDELKGNIDCYGYSVNDKGEVTKINYETMKNDILKNDSKRLNELENQYGKLTIKNTSFNTFEREVEMYCDISKNDLNSDDRYIDRNEEVFVFEVSADVEGQEKLVNRYCVRAKSGEIYIYDNSKRQASFKEIKDNKIVNEYDAVPIC